MVAPVTGPFTKSQTWNGIPPSNQSNSWRIRQSVSHRQKKPYNLPLDRSLIDKQVTSYSRTKVSGSDSNAVFYAYHSRGASQLSDSSSDAYNRAYMDFREKISKGAAWGITLAERKQAMGMMTKRLQQMYFFVKHMKRFRFGDALDALDWPRSRRDEVPWSRLKRNSGALGDNIIELRFGWQPVIGDIHSTAELLSSDIPSGIVVGRSTRRPPGSLRKSDDASSPYKWIKRSYQDHHVHSCRISGHVQMVNPNTALLGNLGLLNPALVVYELVPWSFVFNYFLSLEEWLTGFNPFAGYLVTNTYVTFKQTSRTDAVQTEHNGVSGALTGNRCTYTVKSVYVKRTVGPLSGPKLRVRDPWDLKPGRALNLCALLLQQLRNQR